MKRSLLTRVLVIFGIILFSGYLFSCGCGKLAEKAAQEATKKALEEAQKEMEKQNIQPAPEPAPEKTTEEGMTEESTSPKGYGKMDDDKFVEIVAFDVKMAELMSESKVEPLEYAKQREALLKKLGVTNENYEQYSEHLQTTDLEKYIGLIQKADEIAKEK